MSFPPPNERQARIFWMSLTALAIALLVGLIVLLVWGLGRVLDILSPVLWPLAVAGVVAYLLDPVIDFFERKGFSRPRAIVTVFVLAILIVAGVFSNVVPPIVSQTPDFAARIPTIQAKVIQLWENWINNPKGVKAPAATENVSTNTVSVVITNNAPEL